MSNKPKIYGYCDAGCRWETVHKDDFLNSASIVKHNTNEAGTFTITRGKKYKIAKTVKNATEWGFYVEVLFVASTGRASKAVFTLPACSKYDEYLTFKIVDLLPKNGVLYVVAEANGKIEEYQTSTSATNETFEDLISAQIIDATECYLVNEDAQIEWKPGKVVSTILIDQDENGGNIYEQTFDDGTTARFVAPRGDTGDKGDTGAKIVKTELKGQDENGGNIYEQTFDDGTTARFVAPKGKDGNDADIAQTTGESETKVMSQKATSDCLSSMNTDVERFFVDGELWQIENFDLSKIPTVQIAVSELNNWKTGGSSKFIPVTDFVGRYIAVTGHELNGSVVCFLTSNEYVTDGKVDVYATGTNRTFVKAGESMVFAIPLDCKYINFLDSWGKSYLPQYVKVYKSAFPQFKKSLTEDRIGLTVDKWRNSACVFSTYYTTTVGNAQGVVDVSDNILRASDFVPVNGKMLELPIPWISTTTYPNWGMSLYDADFNPIYGRAVSAIPNRVGDEYVKWIRVYLPENAAYFRTTYWTKDWLADHPSAPPFSYNLLKEIPDAYKPITHELPIDTYMQNAIRRARQLTDIKWTPRVKIPRYSMINGGSDHFLDWFYPDHEYVGIPYSGAGKGEGTGNWTGAEEWGYAHNWVGSCIPIEAFITATRYHNSIFSETVDQTEPNYDSSPFGTVCTALVNYAVNGGLPLRGITNFFDTSDNVFRKAYSNKTIADVDKNGIAIGDFLYTSAHVIMITDLLRDAYGNVTHVEMSEATTVGNGNNNILGSKFGGVARRKMWEYTEFKNLYGAYVKYRRTTFYGIPYTPSKYVDTGNEGDRQNIVDLPCIPYLGNGAIYKVGYIHNSKICIGATGFTSLVVKKDGEEFGTFDVTGLTEVSVGFTDIGSYEAYLTNGTTKTMSCRWTVEN